MRRGQPGFTLVELLVAIAVMALLAIVSWRGLDGMVRAQQITRERADAVLELQTVLAQWGADLDAMCFFERLGKIFLLLAHIGQVRGRDNQARSLQRNLGRRTALARQPATELKRLAQKAIIQWLASRG